ncbi:hypothetical protein [Streptomyces sp. NPDC088350]|uniref:hypothetical protein n=1 Tax=Streptomyces sp. NPDC088350 TaxID=3365854 RepID=UPI0037F94341
MRRRTFVTALGATVAASAVPGVARAASPLIAPTLTGRDPSASANARKVYGHLVSLENAARSGTHPMTIIGQHIETQQELYNASYGDTGGTTFSGYYYKKAADITGKLSGFVEIDLGPGYGATGWGTYGDRSYNRPLGLPTGVRSWQYTDDAVDLACGVRKGLPRTADGSYNPAGTRAETRPTHWRRSPPTRHGSTASSTGSRTPTSTGRCWRTCPSWPPHSRTSPHGTSPYSSGRTTR